MGRKEINGLGERHEDWKQEQAEGRKILREILKDPVVENELMMKKADFMPQPKGAGLLDIGFVPVSRRGAEVVGVNLFSRPDCIGVVLLPSKASYVEAERIVRADKEIGPYLEQGARVVLATVDDLRHWKAFYTQVRESGLLMDLGPKVLEFTGLGRTDEAYSARFDRATDELLEGEVEKFVELGVAEAKVELPARGRFDRAFLDANGKLVGVPMHHVRVGHLQGEVLVEEILSEAVIVPGMVVRKTGENKREAYKRAQDLARYWKNQFGEGRVEVPVVSTGQLSVWRKMGMWSETMAQVGEVEISTEEVIRHLYLGKSNIEPGELARLGLSLPMIGGEFGGIDVMFMKRVRGESQFTAIDNVLGINPRKWGKTKEEFKGDDYYDFDEESEYDENSHESEMVSVANVGGIVIVPEQWTIKQMKAYIKGPEFVMGYKTIGPNSKLLYLTPSLFRAWKERGSIFGEALEVEEMEQSELKRRMEYGYGVGSDLAQIDIEIVRTEAEIGGKRQFVVEVAKNGDEIYYALDAGATFKSIPMDEKSILSRSPTSRGVIKELKYGQVPMKPGLVHTEWILASVKEFPALWQGGGGSVASYIRSELVHRNLWDRTVEIVGEDRAERLFKLGKNDEEKWYQGREVEFGPMVVSHMHADHNGVLSYYSPMEVVTRTEGVAHARAISRRRGTVRDDMLAVANIADGRKGAGYEKEYREYWPIHWDDQKVRLSVNLGVRLPRVNHSITGAAMVAFDDQNGNGIVVDTGDYKPGPLTEKTVENLAGQYPVIIAETTNTLDSFKPSAGVSESTVARTIEELVSRYGKRSVVVVIVPPNHTERVNLVRSIMGNGINRKVAIGPQHAEVIEQMRAEQARAPLGVEGFDMALPEIGVDVGLFAPGKMVPKTYENHLRNKAEGGPLGIVTEERLGEEGREWVVILSPFDKLEHNLGGVSFERQGLMVLHSAHYPYEDPTAWAYANSLRWVNELDQELHQRPGNLRAKYFMDFSVSPEGGLVKPVANYSLADGTAAGLHASGHATFPEAFQVIHGLLGGNYKDKKIVLVHGEHPYVYKRQLAEQFVHEFGEKIKKELRLDQPGGLQVIAKLDTYDPKDPLRKKGFRLRVR